MSKRRLKVAIPSPPPTLRAKPGKSKARLSIPLKDKPADFDKKSIQYQCIGMVLLVHEKFTNEQVCEFLYDWMKLPAPYGLENWKDAYADEEQQQKVFNLIKRIRDWVRIPGRTKKGPR